ncbi:MAG: hypothetical protein IPI79_05565 [Moraxellaceae bacterium]|nr:hypothetical protein [Moraxellaceae bacterium]
MYALRQIYDNPQDFIPVPEKMKNHRMEVIFMVLDELPNVEDAQKIVNPILDFAGCWADMEQNAASFEAEIYTRRQAANRERDDI